MLLYEEFFLLALNDAKSHIPNTLESQMGFGISGAILSDLVLAGRIGLGPKQHLVVVDPHPTGDDLLNEVLGLVDEFDRPHKAVFWVNKLAVSIKKLERRVGMKLVSKGILRREEKRYLWVIPYDAYPEVDASAKYWVKQGLRQMVLEHKEASPQQIALLGLVRACDMLGFIFTRDELKAARMTIDALTFSDEIGKGVRETIEAIEAAAISASLSANFG